MSKSGSKYFGQPLSEICPENSLVPLFVTKCINFVEDSGKFFLNSCSRVGAVKTSPIDPVLLHEET
jgi:hypothetical protein